MYIKQLLEIFILFSTYIIDYFLTFLIIAADSFNCRSLFCIMFYGVTITASAERTTHISHHIHPIDLPHTKTTLLHVIPLKYFYPHPQPKVSN